MRKALIVHVGDKYTRAIKSIEKIKPDLVYFTYNKSYEEYMDKIIEGASVTFEKKVCLIEDFQSIKESYEKSKKIFRELENDNYEIHVGVSNGTKAMVVGLSLASVGFNCEFSYVGSKKGGRENGEVLPGSEKVFDEFHPMKQLATIEINRAKRYFNNYQFSESLRYFKIARDASYNTERMDMYIKIVKLYQKWDKFENLISYINKHNQATDTMLGSYLDVSIKKEIDNNENLRKYFYNHENEFMNQIDRNIAFLKNKISHKGTIKEGNLYYYLPDLLNNAQRRIEEKKFDDATARLYRVAELISQIRLYENNLIEKNRLKNDKVFHIEKENIIKNYPISLVEFVSRQPDFQNPNKKTVKLALKDNYELLKLLNDELAIKFLEDKVLDNALSDRNNSILAHGLIPADERDTKILYEKLVKYAEDTFKNLDECMNYSKFPKFKNYY